MHLKWRILIRCAQSSVYFSITRVRIFKIYNTMQKFVLCTLALFALALAAPQGPEPQQNQQQDVYLISQDANIHPDGYQFSYETSDGTSRHEQGTLKQVSDNHSALEVSGSYRYVAPDGLIYSVTFTADENGYKPQEHVEHQGQEQHQQ